MPQTKTPARRTKKPKNVPPRHSIPTGGEVLTLPEAAAYLRVAENQLAELAARQEIPGRQIAGKWRFLKTALANWLATPAGRGFWETQFGALKEDPYLEEMLRDIYRQRRRPMTENE
jgi:excisionase family DNA binding protein